MRASLVGTKEDKEVLDPDESVSIDGQLNLQSPKSSLSA
jgi:hypothetical protein